MFQCFELSNINMNVYIIEKLKIMYFNFEIIFVYLNINKVVYIIYDPRDTNYWIPTCDP